MTKMDDNQPCAVPRSDLARGAREHYERLATASHEWLSTIPHAIDLWERVSPEVLEDLVILAYAHIEDGDELGVLARHALAALGNPPHPDDA